VVDPPTTHPNTPPTVPPTATPTPTPTDSATPTETPSTASPTDDPTATPTDRKTTEPTTAPTSPGRTVSTKRPTTSPTTTPPPPPVDGKMTGDELQLFNLIDNARVDNGCARLKQDPNLTASARAEAGDRALSGNNLDSGTGAGGDNMTAQQAFDRMMNNSRSTILNCGLTTLGVGAQGSPHDSGVLCPLLCSKKTRVAWVADFS
jgi:hypothetical protein